MGTIHLRDLPDPYSKPNRLEGNPYTILLKYYKTSRHLQFSKGRDFRGREFTGRLIFISQDIRPKDIEGTVFYRCLMFGALPKDSNVTQIECVHRPYPIDMSIRDIPLIGDIAIARGHEETPLLPPDRWISGYDYEYMQIQDPVSIRGELNDAVFDHSRVDGWECNDTSLRRSSFRYAEVSSSQFSKSSFVFSDFSGACFINCTFSRCDFRRCEFEGSSFLNCEFADCYFEYARLEGSDLKTSKASWDLRDKLEAELDSMNPNTTAYIGFEEEISAYGRDLWMSHAKRSELT